MTSAVIDLDALNDLFENQNKLDDIFNSIFDEDSFLSNSMSLDDHPSGSMAQEDNQDFYSNDDFSFYAKDKTSVQNIRGIMHVAIPVAIEIVAVSYGIMYFT